MTPSPAATERLRAWVLVWDGQTTSTTDSAMAALWRHGHGAEHVVEMVPAAECEVLRAALEKIADSAKRYGGGTTGDGHQFCRELAWEALAATSPAASEGGEKA